MAMPTAIRHINQARLLDTLFREGPMSRAGLARRLGTTRATAGNLVRRLEAEGLVRALETDGPAPTLERQGDPLVDGAAREVGRPGRRLDINPDHAYFAGADIGVGYISVVLINLKADLVADIAVPIALEAETPDAVAALLDRALDDLLAKVGAEPADLCGLCVSVAGLVDKDGLVLRAPYLGWHDVPLLALIAEARRGLPPIGAENDANAFAFAETYRSSDTGTRNALFIWLDAGVGGGIMLDGALVRGIDGYAGELGHIFVGDDGVPSSAPLPGTLESYVGRESVLTRNRALGGRAATLPDFFAELTAGAPAAKETANLWARALGRGIANLVSVLNPAKIVLGGPVAPLYPFVAPQLGAAIRNGLLADNPIPAVELSRQGDNAVAIGGAYRMHQAFLEIDEDIVFGASNGA